MQINLSKLPLFFKEDTPDSCTWSTLVVLFLAALACHWPDLLNGGVYFDDRFFGYVGNLKFLMSTADQIGHPYFGWWHLLISFPLTKFKIYLSRFITFTAYVGIGFFFWKISRRLKFLDEWMALLLGILFLTAPVAPGVRVFITINQYVICLLLFMIGFYFALFKTGYLWRIISLACFVLSFLTNSLLVLYGIVLLTMLIVAIESAKYSFVLTCKFFLKKIDFILLPILFFFTKQIIFPSGSYNAIIPAFVFGFFDQLLTFMQSNFLEPAKFLQDILLVNLSNVCLFALVVLFWCLYLQNKINDHKSRLMLLFRAAIFSFLGFLLFILAIFPYYAVAKYPILYDWHNRNQLLVPFSYAFFGVSFVTFVMSLLGKRAALICSAMIITAFTLVSIKFSLEYQRDWLKQLSLSAHFRTNKIFASTNSILFCDDYKYNALARQYAWYDYSGLFNEVTGRAVFGQDYSLATKNSGQLTFLIELKALNQEKPDLQEFSDYVQLVLSWWKPDTIFQVPFKQKGDLVFTNIVVDSQFLSSPSLLVDMQQALEFSLNQLFSLKNQDKFLLGFMTVKTITFPKEKFNTYMRDYIKNGDSYLLNLLKISGPQCIYS